MLAEAAASRFSTAEIVAGELGDDAAAIEDQRAVADLGDLLEIGRDDEDGGARLSARHRTAGRSPPWRRHRRRRSDPRRRRPCRRDAASGRPRPSAGCRRTASSIGSDRVVRPQADAFDRAAPRRRDSARGARYETRLRARRRRGLRNRFSRTDRLGTTDSVDPVGADEVDARAQWPARGERRGDRFAVEHDASAGHRRKPEQRAADAFLAGAAQADEADHLARAHAAVERARAIRR